MEEFAARILILSHGDFCESALRTAALLGADTSGAVALPLRENVPMEEYVRQVSEELDHLPDGSLVFLDLFGGTPFNTVARLLLERQVFAFTGFNLPMLIEAMSSRDVYAGEELAQAVLDAGQAGMRDVQKFLSGLRDR